jgi:hypothetical protein
MRPIIIFISLLISQQLFAPILTDNHIEIVNNFRKSEIEYKKNKELQRFLYDLSISESGNDYTKWNNFGYIGKYQFGYSARKMTGFEHITFRDFIRNPEIWDPADQETALLNYIKQNQYNLQEIIDKIESGNLVIKIKGKPITKSGILAGAHIAGYAGVKRYVRNKSNPKDVFGTSLEDYMYNFSGYDF